MNKIKNIEFLRTYLILAVVILHMFIERKWCLCSLFPDISLYQGIKTAVAHSNNCVEGFFIIAGFLLALTFKSKISIKNFILKKYIRLTPVIIFSIFLCFFGFLLGAMNFDIIPNLLTIGLLNQFVIKIAVGQNPVLWYTSVLFAGLFLYFLILKYFKKNLQIFIISVLVFLSYGVLEFLQHGSFANPLKNYFYIFNIGFLRAVGGIGIGCLVYEINKFLSEIELNKFFVTMFELVLLILFVWWTIFPHKSINNILFVVLFSILLILFLLQKGYLSKYLNSDIWVNCGKYQYSIYVVHYVVIRILGLCVWKNHSIYVHLHPVISIILTLLTIIFFGLFAYYVVELPCKKYLTSIMEKNFAKF